MHRRVCLSLRNVVLAVFVLHFANSGATAQVVEPGTTRDHLHALQYFIGTWEFSGVRSNRKVTGIDPVTKQVTFHWFAPGGGRGIGHWFRDTENKKKRMTQSQWVTGSGNVGASVRIVEEQDADTRTVQWVGNFRDGELSEGDGSIGTRTRVKSEK